MRVREASLEDTAAIVAMATCFLAESLYGGLFPANPERLAALVRVCLDQGVILIAENEAGIVGMLALVAVEDPFAGVPYADEIAWWVDPKYRDSIVGPRLLMKARNWTRAHRLAFLKMVAPANAPHVAAFYERVGFQKVETSYIERV